MVCVGVGTGVVADRFNFVGNTANMPYLFDTHVSILGDVDGDGVM